MSIWAKFAIVFMCVAICALSVTRISHAQDSRGRQKQETTPVLLHDSQPAHGLLV